MTDIVATVPWLDDDQGWRLTHYWLDGEGYTECDEDGNHEPIDSAPDAGEVDKAWQAYAVDCLRTGADPLSEYFVSTTIKTDHVWQASFVPSILGPVAAVRRRGRGAWIYDLSRAPQEVRDYLSVTPRASTRWVFTDDGEKHSRMDRLLELARADTGVTVQRHPRGLQFLFTVTEARGRGRTRYQRALRAHIRKAGR